MANIMDDQNFEDMSRDELVAIIGTDVDENASHDQLVAMAKRRSSGSL